MREGRASEKMVSLCVPLCLTHAGWLPRPCRWTTFDLPCWPFSGGKGYQSHASCLSHVLSQVAMNMLSNDYGIFPSLAVTLLSSVNIPEGTLITRVLWRTDETVSDIHPSKLTLSSVSIKWWGCVHLVPPLPPPPALATIDFLCVWQARDLVSREETFSRNRAGAALHLPYLLLLNI